MPDARAISAINSTLFDEGSGFGKELNRFGIWTFYTNYRAKAGEYFEEAANYPLVHPVSVIPMNSSSVNVTVNAYPTSNNFIYFINSAESDTLTVLVTNSDLNKGIDSTHAIYCGISRRNCTTSG